jgi:hypothetical protein
LITIGGTLVATTAPATATVAIRQPLLHSDFDHASARRCHIDRLDFALSCGRPPVTLPAGHVVAVVVVDWGSPKIWLQRARNQFAPILVE